MQPSCAKSRQMWALPAARLQVLGRRALRLGLICYTIDQQHGENISAAGFFLKRWLLTVSGTTLAPSLCLFNSARKTFTMCSRRHLCQKTHTWKLQFPAVLNPRPTTGAGLICLVRQRNVSGSWKFVILLWKRLIGVSWQRQCSWKSSWLKAWHFPAAQGPLMGFHMFIACLLERPMNILTTRHVLICGIGRSQALNILESMLPVAVPGYLCAWENEDLILL